MFGAYKETQKTSHELLKHRLLRGMAQKTLI